MTEIRDGERIFGDLIFQAAAHGLISEDRAEALNEELQQFVERLESAYDPDTDARDHVVTAREPAWVEQKHVADSDGNPQRVSAPHVTESVEGYYDESSYACSCGADLDSWHEVQTHLRETTETDDAE